MRNSIHHVGSKFRKNHQILVIIYMHLLYGAQDGFKDLKRILTVA